jgi:hypothetical protein
MVVKSREASTEDCVAEDSIAEGRTSAYWLELAASGRSDFVGPPGPTSFLAVASDYEAESCSEALSMQKSLGWFHANLRLPKELVLRCAELIQICRENGYSPSYALVYPELWKLMLHPVLQELIQTIIGNDSFFRSNPVLHFVDDCSKAGWPPHADGLGEEYADSANLNLQAVWIALSDATLDNGCMHVLSNASSRVFWELINSQQSVSFSALQRSIHGVRAIPCVAGDVLGWHGGTVHFGGEYRAGAPRISLALEAQPAGCRLDQYSEPLQEPASFEAKLRLARAMEARYRS